jgi:uncharacterized protein YraI
MDCTSQFAVGQRVQTNSNLNVRATPSTLNGSLGVQNMGVAGTIVGGGIFAGTHYWWNINYDTGVDGWSAQDYLFGN